MDLVIMQPYVPAIKCVKVNNITKVILIYLCFFFCSFNRIVPGGVCVVKVIPSTMCLVRCAKEESESHLATSHILVNTCLTTFFKFASVDSIHPHKYKRGKFLFLEKVKSNYVHRSRSQVEHQSPQYFFFFWV